MSTFCLDQNVLHFTSSQKREIRLQQKKRLDQQIEEESLKKKQEAEAKQVRGWDCFFTWFSVPKKTEISINPR